MRVKFFSFFLALAMYSCNTNGHNASSYSNVLNTNKTITEHTQIRKRNVKDLPAPKGYNILLPNCYRLFENDPTKCITKQWLELYEEDGNYFLGVPEYTVENSFDECAQVASNCIRGKRNTIVFLNNSNFVLGQIQTNSPATKEILPRTSGIFQKGIQSYSVSAWGDVKENCESDENWESYTNIKFRISIFTSDGIVDQTLFTFNSLLNDSYFKVLFAGDLNGDKRNDFIIQVSTFYEEYTVYIYLSNGSQTPPFLDLYAQLLYQFDC